jgi:hypothetical protein
VRVVAVLLLVSILGFGETLKLYLKDGGYHAVREYQVQGDRVRYFSTERGDWEEIPKELVDLEKTERERKVKSEELTKEARAQDEEDQAERALRKEIQSIPIESGAYYKQDEKIETLPSAEFQVITDKKRKAIMMISPVPLIPGKATVVIKGERAKFVVKEPRPNFYFRLSKEERFGIVKLTPKKNVRVVENISIIPVSKEAYEERKQMDTFQQQLAPDLYKIWPEKPLGSGEYAIIEFSDSGDQTDLQLLIWDFSVEGGQ